MAAPRQQSEPRLASKPRVGPEDVCAGCIVWLPSKDPLNSGVQCNCAGCLEPSALDDAGYDHPVVVVKVRQKRGSVTIGDLVCDVACVTTFSNIDLESYFSQRNQGKRHHLRDSLPIFHTFSRTEGIDHSLQLRFEEGNLAKQSYVRTKHIYEVDISNLRQYGWRRSRAYRLRLSEASYSTLARSLALSGDEYVATNMVRQEASRRLQLLARPQSAVPSRPQSVRPVTQPDPNQTPICAGSYPQYQPGVSHNYNVPPRHNVSTSALRAPSNSHYDSHSQQDTPPNPEASEGSPNVVVLVVILVVVAWLWWLTS